MAGSVNLETICKHVLLFVFALLEKYWNAPLPDYKNTNYLLSVQYFCLLLCSVCDKGHTKVGT